VMLTPDTSDVKRQTRTCQGAGAADSTCCDKKETLTLFEIVAILLARIEGRLTHAIRQRS
jgi:hypothetical protein